MVLMRVPVPDGRGRVSRQRRLGGVVATVAVVVVSALGAPAASAQMRAGLRLDVFVDDADGAPVTDLRRGDFFATRPRTLVEATIDLDAVQDGVTGGQSACRKGGRGGRFGDRGVLECPIVSLESGEGDSVDAGGLAGTAEFCSLDSSRSQCLQTMAAS